jgi:hypothetical protein
LSVNNSIFFIDLNALVNTPTIESYWSKKEIRVKTVRVVFSGTLKLLLDECMFKEILAWGFIKCVDVNKTLLLNLFFYNLYSAPKIGL